MSLVSEINHHIVPSAGAVGTMLVFGEHVLYSLAVGAVCWLITHLISFVAKKIWKKWNLP
jgi:hypothetical protein